MAKKKKKRSYAALRKRKRERKLGDWLTPGATLGVLFYVLCERGALSYSTDDEALAVLAVEMRLLGKQIDVNDESLVIRESELHRYMNDWKNRLGDDADEVLHLSEIALLMVRAVIADRGEPS